MALLHPFRSCLGFQKQRPEMISLDRSETIILSVWGGYVFCVSHDVLMNDHNTKYVFCIVSGL